MSAVPVVGGAGLGRAVARREVHSVADTAFCWHQTHPKGYSSAE